MKLDLDIEYCETLLKVLPTPMVLTNCEGEIQFVNKPFEELTQYSFEELKDKKIGKGSGILYSGFHADSFYKEMWETIKSGSLFRGQVKNKKKNGETYWQEVSIIPVGATDGGEHYKPYFIASITDITKTRHSKLTLSAVIDNLGEEQIIAIFEKDHSLLEVLGESADPIHEILRNNLNIPIQSIPIYNKEIIEYIEKLFNKVDQNPKQRQIGHYSYQDADGVKDLEIIVKRFNSSRFMLILNDVTSFRDYVKIKMGLTELEQQVERLIQSRTGNTETGNN